jgi:hypothetical protein
MHFFPGCSLLIISFVTLVTDNRHTLDEPAKLKPTMASHPPKKTWRTSDPVNFRVRPAIIIVAIQWIFWLIIPALSLALVLWATFGQKLPKLPRRLTMIGTILVAGGIVAQAGGSRLLFICRTGRFSLHPGTPGRWPPAGLRDWIKREARCLSSRLFCPSTGRKQLFPTAGLLL